MTQNCHEMTTCGNTSKEWGVKGVLLRVW